MANLERQKKLLDTQKYTDMTITCHERSWTAHRSVVCLASEYLASECERLEEDAKDGQLTIELHDENEHAISAFRRYCYVNDYDDPNIKPAEMSASTFHFRIYVLASKFGVASLREEAKENLCAELETSWKDDCFPEIIQEVWASLPESAGDAGTGLRDYIVAIASQHAKELFSYDITKYAVFKGMAWSLPDFAADVLRYKACNPAAGVRGRSSDVTQARQAVQAVRRRYCCPRCQAAFTTFIHPDHLFQHECHEDGVVYEDAKNEMLGSEWLDNLAE